jgi:hypothetical protein
MIEEPTDDHINSMADNIVLGLERTLEDLGEKLPLEVDGMSAKQLRRAMKALIGYTATRADISDIKTLTERERKFLAGLMALQESSINYTIHILGQVQQAQDAKENK